MLPDRHRPAPRRGSSYHPRKGVAELLLFLALVVFAAVMMYGSASSTRARSRSRQQEEEGVSRHAAPVRVTIFSAQRPPPEGSPARQELAVRSWLALPGNVSVVLLGASHAAAALAERLGSRVTVDAAIDSAFTGTPFFHSMVARAQAASDSDFCVLTDAEIVLLPEFVNVITRLSKVDRDWFLVSMSRNTTKFQYQPIDSGSDWVHKHGKKEEIPADKWVADSSDRGIIMAWNNPSNPLQAGVLPPFLYGRDVHNSWFMHEVVSSEMRLIFDASSLVLGLHPPEGFILMHTMSLSKNDRLPIGSSWDYSINQYLAAVYGSYCYQLPRRHSTMLYKVVKHSEDYKLSKGDVLTLSNFVTGKEDKVYTHGSNPWRKEDICFSWHDHSNSFMTSAPVNLPYSLSILLELVADKNKSVVLGVAGENYKDMLMSWACRLRHLGITNFIVCALDHEIYEFSVLQGLPVFRNQLSLKNVSFDNCHFGTKCFQQVTKMKSRIVLEILRLGYNVLLSDVDVYWFHNPMPYMYSLGPATFGAQSDEYNDTGPINLPRRLNSGFYFARSDDATIAAMKMVVKHAENSGLSEQPSFYDVLCGKDGANRIGDDKCLEPNTSLTVVFLQRDLFPNGAYKGLWEEHDVESICKEIGCFIIHNNWISGRKKKLLRQMASGLWDYDPTSRLCLQNWSDKSRYRIKGQFHPFEH